MNVQFQGEVMDKIINIVGIILVAVGSVLSLWTIITTKTSFVGTCDDWDSKQEQFKKEKVLVFIGCVLIVVGSVLQICSNCI